jgi:hypothetical protein
MDLTIVLSTDIQNWYDYNAFQLPTSTAQCEQIDMSHHLESCIRRFLLLHGVQGQLVRRCLYRSVEASKAKHGLECYVEADIIHGRLLLYSFTYHMYYYYVVCMFFHMFLTHANW